MVKIACCDFLHLLQNLSNISERFTHQKVNGKAEYKQCRHSQNYHPDGRAKTSRTNPGTPVSHVHQSITKKVQKTIHKTYGKQGNHATYHQIKCDPLAKVFDKIMLQFYIPLPRPL